MAHMEVEWRDLWLCCTLGSSGSFHVDMRVIERCSEREDPPPQPQSQSQISKQDCCSVFRAGRYSLVKRDAKNLQRRDQRPARFSAYLAG